MRWVRVAVVMVVVGAVAPFARGQEMLFQQPQVVDPLAAGGPQLLLAPPNGPVVGGNNPGAPPAWEAGVRGLVGGHGVDNRANASVGFTYLVPLWSFRAFQLPVPRGFESFFPEFGSSGPVDTHFAYAPRVNLHYYVADWDLEIGTTGTFLNLSGRVDRQTSGTAGPSGLLTAYANLTLVSATLPEFGRKFAFEELFPEKAEAKPRLVDSVLDLRIGTRYVGLDQNYSGTLIASGTGVPGSSVATRFSSQTFRGIGLTAVAIWEIPCWSNWAFYTSVRESAILGENRRNSSVTVTVPGQPGFADAQLESRTVLVPVTELEFGADWGMDLATRMREGLDPPRFVIRTAAVAQYWGGLGPLSAGSNQNFRSTDLFLVGGYIQAGFRY
jgi:hypothetical protein